MTAPTDPPPPPPHPLLAGLVRTLGPSLARRIASAPILLVGAGGIGCELLKDLALSGFNRVTVVDLDTIDVSNLNRQFLFRSRHVGQPKCAVACEVGRAMAPAAAGAGMSGGGGGGSSSEEGEGEGGVQYKALHGNVCDTATFNVSYIGQFALVLNALDNVTARRRVNRLCLAAKVPLIEAGTTGYLGQVTVIDKPSGVECYECQTKPTQKVYPICTIRSTPSMPVHCIVWAKELYKLLFGDKVEDSMLFEDEEVGKDEGDAGEEGEKKEGGNNDDEEEEPSGPSTYMEPITTLRTLLRGGGGGDGATAASVQEQAATVLTALYATEITKQIDMGRYKTAAKVPAPLSSEDLAAESTPPTAREGYDATDIWSKKDCTTELVACITQAYETYKSVGESGVAPAFDKDDEMAMRFVTAAANLRQYVFKIDPIQSLYSAKGIAGNIIPAIATTNAIVAGLQILQAFHILRVQLEADGKGDAAAKEAEGRYKSCCRTQYCLRNPTRKGFLLQPSALADPNPKCFVCRSATVDVTLDTKTWTMEQLLKIIIKGQLGFAEPTILINGDLVYEEGDGAEEDYVCNLPKTLDRLPAGGIHGGTVVRVEDFTQDLEVDLAFVQKDDWDADEAWKEKDAEQRYIVGGDKPVAAPAAAAPAAEDKGGEEKKDEDDKPAADEDSDDEIIIEEDPAPPLKNGVISKKRKAEAAADEGEDGAEMKKAKKDDIVAVDEAADDVIEIE